MNMKNKTIKTEGRAQLFQNPVLEALTVSSPLESTITSVGISALCIWLGFLITPALTAGQALLWFGIGVISWSLFEYLLHRYLFHLVEGAFPGSDRLTYLLHGVHHEYPNDAQRTLMPFAPKVIFSVVFFGLFYLIFGKVGPFFSSGFLIGYYLYSMLHYAIHRFKAPKGMKFLWTHHHLHHHLHSDKAFGVSSRFWDRVFKTMPPLYEKKEKVASGGN